MCIHLDASLDAMQLTARALQFSSYNPVHDPHPRPRRESRWCVPCHLAPPPCGGAWCTGIGRRGEGCGGMVHRRLHGGVLGRGGECMAHGAREGARVLISPGGCAAEGWSKKDSARASGRGRREERVGRGGEERAERQRAGEEWRRASEEKALRQRAGVRG